MKITVKDYKINGGTVTILCSKEGKNFNLSAKFYDKIHIPDFFYEMFAITCLTTPNPIFPKGDNILQFDFPVSLGARKYLDGICDAHIGDYNIRLVADTKEEFEDTYFNLDEGYQLQYTRGSDSGLSYCVIDELGKPLFLSITPVLNNLRYEKYPANKFENNPDSWRNVPMNCNAVVHAIHNNANTILQGSELNLQFRCFSVYFQSNDFYEIFNEYIGQWTNIKLSSVVSCLPSNVVYKILNRYPRYNTILKKGEKTALYVYYATGKKNYCPGMGNFNPSGHPDYITKRIEIEHVMNKLRGDPFLCGHKLQYSDNFHPWVEKCHWHRHKPLAYPKGLKKLYGEEVKFCNIDIEKELKK